MIFRGVGRVVYLLAVGFASSCFVQAGPLVNAASSPKIEGSAPLRVTVQDVERILAEDKGRSDKEIARQLSGLELTERMSTARLQALEQSVPGTKSRWALVALADASVFLAPAPADVVSQAPPDLNEQRRMIALTVDYLAKTVPRLPNFYATRITDRYEKKRRLRNVSAGSWNDPFRSNVGTSKVVVAYRDGKEVVNPREWGKRGSHRISEGLITKGVFGPILSTVILDAGHGEVTWEHWERGKSGTLAVFRYRVPKDQSHYAVELAGLSGDGDQGYRGEVAIDPATGTILRLTVRADLPIDSPIFRGDIMVEYGPVEIGGKTYTCPVRSVSISATETWLMHPITETTLLNDVTFEDYHVFRSETRILPGFIPAPHQ